MSDVDDLAQFIRQVDGNHTMGAGALAEAIVAYQLEALLADGGNRRRRVMSDRTAQARAEAERQIHVYGDDFKARTLQANLNDAFVQGVAWADENPRPRTITADQCNDIEEGVHKDVPLGRMLRRLGIEVVDDDG